MNVRINQLVKSLLRKDSLEQCSLHELRIFADQNPYFGAAQLLLTKKLQQENASDYESQLQKTYMFFHNPLWVEQLLNDTGHAVIKPAPAKKDTPLAETVVLPEAIPVISAVQPVEELTVPLTDEPAADTGITAVSVAGKEDALSPAAETVSGISAIHLAEDVLNTAPTVDMAVTTEAMAPPPSAETTTISPTDIPQAASVVETAELAFEPFYTVDYFASQGIKLKDENRPKDKFGQQLKSFTDWLKTMKRLPAAEMAAMTAGQGGETKVVQLAEHSLEEKEVVTEAMAAVWEKQGNIARAIAVYTKLSLLEPAKSPYFAAKIEELKKSN